jgi:hypothetical protein
LPSIIWPRAAAIVSRSSALSITRSRRSVSAWSRIAGSASFRPLSVNSTMTPRRSVSSAMRRMWPAFSSGRKRFDRLSEARISVSSSALGDMRRAQHNLATRRPPACRATRAGARRVLPSPDPVSRANELRKISAGQRDGKRRMDTLQAHSARHGRLLPRSDLAHSGLAFAVTFACFVLGYPLAYLTAPGPERW